MSEKMSEQSIPVQEIKTQTVVSVKKFMKSVLVVFLSFLCICVGVLIYQLHEDFHPVYGKSTKTNKVEKIRTAETKKEKPVPVVLDKNVVEQKDSLEGKTEKTTTSLPLTAPMMSVPAEEKTTPVVLEKADIEKETPMMDIKQVEETPVPIVEKETILPLSVALELRDKLIMGEGCAKELQQVIAADLPQGVDKTKMVNVLMPICRDSSAYAELKTLFAQEKKNALTTFYRMNNPNKWVAYMKAVFSTLIEVRRLNPVKKRPKDLMSLAQNALNQHNIEETIVLVQKLPTEMQADFNGFLEEAKAYVSAQEAIDGLVFSYERGK